MIDLGVVLINGFALSTRVWAAQRSFLKAGGIFVVGGDYYESAPNGMLPTQYYSAMLGDMERAVVVALSRGCLVIPRLGAELPEKILASVCISPRRKIDLGMIQEYERLFRAAKDGRLSPRALQTVMCYSLGPEAPLIDCQSVYGKICADLSELATTTTPGVVRPVGHHTVSIHGSEDRSLDTTSGMYADVLRIDGAGHFPNMTHPDRVNSVILAAIRRISDTGQV